MRRLVLLDSGPLGLLSHPRHNPEIQEWTQRLAAASVVVTIPEIIDYEVRRELLRAEKSRGLQRLDVLKNILHFAPITSEVMLTAAELWAEARRRGRPTAGNEALDIDVILAAHAKVLTAEGNQVEIVTSNVGHLGQMASASHWTAIKSG